MFTFFKEAIKELQHIVWPTPKETRKYMNYTISVIIAMAIFLSLLGYIFQIGFVETRKYTGNTLQPIEINQDINDLSQNGSITISTGAIETGATDTGATTDTENTNHATDTTDTTENNTGSSSISQ